MRRNQGYAKDIIWPKDNRGPDVLYFYDYPMLLIAGSSTGHRQLVVAVDEDEDNVAYYLATTISARRERAVRNNNMTLFQAFAHSEHPLYMLTYGSEYMSRYKGLQELLHTLLPTRGARLRPSFKRHRYGNFRFVSGAKVGNEFLVMKPDYRKSKYADRTNCVYYNNHWYFITSRRSA